MRYLLIVSLSLTLIALTNPAIGDEKPALSLEGHIALPNVHGRIDHLGVDVGGQRLFVAAVENGTLEVIDVKAGRHVRTVGDLAEPQGVLYDSAKGRLFVACADGTTKVFDGASFELLATVKFPDDADNVRYDARRQALIIGYGGAKQLRKRTEGTGGLGFVDVEGNRAGDVVIDAHPESFRIEESSDRIFVNVPEKKEIEVVEAATRVVLDRWAIKSAEGNFPMALDEAHHRLFVGTWTPSRMLVLDTQSGRQVASHDIAGRSDDMFYDARRGRIYVLASGGFLEVFQQKDPDHYELIGHYPTPLNTQTGLFVPEWGKLFAAVRRKGDQDAEVRVYGAN